MSALVQIEKVSKTYKRGSQQVQVLHDLDLEIAQGEFVALMGPSGSGKSTLLNLIGGIDAPTKGCVGIAGTRIDQKSNDELAIWRRSNVGFVFQFYNLFPALTALDNVEVPLLLTDLNKQQRIHNAQLALKLVGLQDRSTHKPTELSGGQQQRVAIARAIVSDPKIFVCDEPTGDLDRESAESILKLLQELNRNYGKTIVMVTHDPRAAEFAGRTLRLDKGRFEVTAAA